MLHPRARGCARDCRLTRSFRLAQYDTVQDMNAVATLATICSANRVPSVRLGRPAQTGEYIKSKARHQHYERWCHRLNQISKTILLPVIVFWLYLVIGAFLFQHLERDVEAQAHDEV